MSPASPAARRAAQGASGFELCAPSSLRLGSWRVVAYAASLNAPSDPLEGAAVLHAAVLPERWNVTQAVAAYRRTFIGPRVDIRQSLKMHGVPQEDLQHVFDFAQARAGRGTSKVVKVKGCSLGWPDVDDIAEVAGTSQREVSGTHIKCIFSRAMPNGGFQKEALPRDPSFGPGVGEVQEIAAALHLSWKGGQRAMLRLRFCSARPTSSGGADASDSKAARTAPVTVTACSQPLYGFRKLRRQHRHFLEDWIRYHRDFFGVDFQIYDIDGSFGHGLGRNFAKFVRYVPRWPESVSPALQEMSSSGFPLAAEVFAYTHCLTSQRARGHAAILLHTPDTYLRLAPGKHFEDLLERLWAQLGGWQYVTYMSVRVKNFARSQSGEAGKRRNAQTRPFWQHGSVVATSRVSYVTLEWGFRPIPILNPENCVGSDAHGCCEAPGIAERHTALERSKVGDVWGWLGNPTPRKVGSELTAHHYVELWSWDIGRCNRMFHQISPAEQGTIPRHDWHCGHQDPSLLWLPDYLAQAANRTPAGAPISGPFVPVTAAQASAFRANLATA